MDCDAIVIGAGLAGLAASAELAAHDQRVLLVEARDRIGGRAFTASRTAGHPVELGAEWFERGGAIDDLVRHAGHEALQANGEFYHRRAPGVVEPVTHDDEAPASLRERISALAGDDRSLTEALDEVAATPIWADARRDLEEYVGGFHAADPSRVSIRWIDVVEQQQPADAADTRTLGGLDHLAAHLLQRGGSNVTTCLGTAVQRVEWRRDHVIVSAAGSTGQWHAPRCIVTLPLAVLQLDPSRRGAVLFDPPLRQKDAALAQLHAGNVTKVVLECREPFWLEGSTRDALFVQSLDAPLPVWWTPRPATAPIITGWAGGLRADALAGLDRDALERAAIVSVAKAFDVAEATVDATVRAMHHHDWRRDPYARAAYSYIAPGGLDAPRALGWALEGTLFFAGEATAPDGMNATMEGALESGRRAARELLQHAGALR